MPAKPKFDNGALPLPKVQLPAPKKAQRPRSPASKRLIESFQKSRRKIAPSRPAPVYYRV